MKQLPQTNSPVVIRTDFENQKAWETICKSIRAPVPFGDDAFYAYVEFVDDTEFRNLSVEDLLNGVPDGYKHSFLVVVDGAAVANAEFPILVIDLHAERGRTFRAIPATVQSIENNLSIANMDFFEFADNVDEDGVFRGFPTT